MRGLAQPICDFALVLGGLIVGFVLTVPFRRKGGRDARH